MIVLLGVVVWGIAELLWAAVPVLRPHRFQLRLQLALFVTVVTAIYAGTVSGVIPERFHYGNGVLRYASDSLTYQKQGVEIAERLRDGSFDVLAASDTFFYAKLLGLIFAATGSSVFAAMLANGFFYTVTLVCIFLIGHELFGDWVAARAMGVAALWPGFFLHEVQTLRLVATTLGLELFVLGTVIVIGHGWRTKALLLALLGDALLLNDQPYVARLLYITTGVFAVALGSIAWRNPARRQAALAMAALALALYMAFDVLWAVQAQRADEIVARQVAARPAPESTIERQWEWIERNLLALAIARQGYEMANLEQSDGTLSGTPPPLLSPKEILINFPTAIASALFVPTPGEALSDRPGVSNLRRFVLVEMVPYYAMLVLACLAIVNVCRAGRRTAHVTEQTAFILMLILAAYAVLGTVVVNAGTLYRFRQPYVLLQAIFAVQGWRLLKEIINARTSSSPHPIQRAHA